MIFQRIFLICAFPVFFLIGCSGHGDVDADTQTPEQKVLTLSRDRWQQSEMHNYRFTLTTMCYCLPEGPITIVVKDNAVVDAYYADSQESVSVQRLSSLFTLDKLFAKVEQAYASQAARVDVTYHPTFGYPETLYIDQDRRLADEEIGYKVTDFVDDAKLIYEVKIAILTGERQCEGGGVAIEALKRQLTASGFSVLNASCGWDGRVYPAICGEGTGKIGIFKLLSQDAIPKLPEGFIPLSQLPSAQITPCASTITPPPQGRSDLSNNN